MVLYARRRAMEPEAIKTMNTTEIITTPVCDTSEISRYEQARLNWRVLRRAMVKHQAKVAFRAIRGLIRAALGISLKAS